MSSRRPLREQYLQLKVLRLIDQNPLMGPRDLARRLGTTVRTLECCLGSLDGMGWLRFDSLPSPENLRKRVCRLLTPAGLEAKVSLTRAVLQRKLAECEALKAEIEALQTEAAGASE